MQAIQVQENTVITFTTQKTGRPDLKKDGGLVRGKHTVQVQMLVGPDHRTIAALDLARVNDIDQEALKQSLKDKGLTFTDLDFELALTGNQPRKKGLITSLTETATQTQKDNKHLGSYSLHPANVKGVQIHDGTGMVYVKGIILSEKVISADPNGDARKTQSGLHVQIKNMISKELNLTSRKWRQYRLPVDAVVNGIANPSSC